MVKRKLKGALLAVLYLGVFGLFLIAHAPPVLAAAKQSTLTLSITDETPLVTIIPLTEGNFDKSSDVAVSVSTDNFTGYNLNFLPAPSLDGDFGCNKRS